MPDTFTDKVIGVGNFQDNRLSEHLNFGGSNGSEDSDENSLKSSSSDS
jgi:hypothetical protein